MTERYEVSWVTETNANLVAKDVDQAATSAMRMAMDGFINGTPLPDVLVHDLHTGKKTVVTVDKEYKVVKVHELD